MQKREIWSIFVEKYFIFVHSHPFFTSLTFTMYRIYYSFICIALISLGISQHALAQREADYWFFGENAGLDFSSGEPEPLINGKMNTYEGCTTFSDSLGNLIFYTDGKTVWNRKDSVMKNGTGLFGHGSSAQSALAVAQPEKSSLYYLFTVDVLFDDKDTLHRHKGLNYSVIDSQLDNGRGEITIKNHALLDSVTERLTAVRHQNQRDIWFITHQWGSDAFYAYLLSPAGLSAPVVSHAGSVHRGLDHIFLAAIGQMKASPQGDKLVVSSISEQNYELFHFDKQSGNVSFIGALDFPYYPYSCSFSPDGTKLYMSNKDQATQQDEIWQAEVTHTDTATINASLQLIHTFVLGRHPGGMQLANNGKIYIAIDRYHSLYAVNSPDSAGVACDFQVDAVRLEGKKSRLGLPDFPQYFFHKPYFLAKPVCFGDSTRFIPDPKLEFDSLRWTFGDLLSGDQNTSTQASPLHSYSSPGTYSVYLHTWKNGIPYNFKEKVKILPPPALDLGRDTVHCLQKQDTLYAKGLHWDILWNDSSTEDSLSVIQDGQYSVTVRNTYTGCRNSDTIHIRFSQPVPFSLGNDTLICSHTPLRLSVPDDSYQYLWQDGSTNDHFIADTEGIYSLRLTTALGCISSDTIHIESLSAPIVSLPEDQLLCEGEEWILTPKVYNPAELLWQDGSSSATYPVHEAGVYTIQASNICGLSRDTIEIRYEYCGDIYIPNILTPNSDTYNECFVIKGIDKEVWDLYIYNRWGQEIYHSTDYQNQWKGADKNGNTLPSGVYYYLLIRPDDHKQYKGFVHIQY